MSLFGRNIISSQVVKAKTDRLTALVLRDAQKKIKNEELIDSSSFELYLQTIDAQFAHIKNDIGSATQTANYTKIRTEKIAETRQLLDFFGHDHAELARLYQIVLQKAKKADKLDDLRQEKLSSIDMGRLKDDFNALLKHEEA